MPALVSPLRAWLSALVATESGVLRSDRFPAELGAIAYPLINEDRTCEVRYLGSVLRPFAGTCRYLDLAFEIRVAYRHATEPVGVTSTDGDALASTARDRCADDAAMIREVCLTLAHYGAASNGAVVVMLTPGAHTIEDGEGVVVGVLPVAMVASYTPTAVTVGAGLA